MEKLFYKIQYKLTVKEINDYADSIEDKTDIDCKVRDWIDTFRCMYSSCAFGKPYYSTGKVTLIGNCPDSWEEEQIEEYIYGEDGLNLRESDTYYMCGDISLVSKKYKP